MDAPSDRRSRRDGADNLTFNLGVTAAGPATRQHSPPGISSKGAHRAHRTVTTMNEQRQQLAYHLSPYDRQREARLASTLLIDIAIDGRTAALRRPRIPRKLNARQQAYARQAENFHAQPEEALA